MNQKRKHPPSKKATSPPFKSVVIWLFAIICIPFVIYLEISSPGITELNKSIPTFQDPMNFQCLILLPVSLLVCTSQTIQKAILKKNRKFEEVQGWFVLMICISCVMLSTSWIKILLEETNNQFSLFSGSWFVIGIITSMLVSVFFGLNLNRP